MSNSKLHTALLSMLRLALWEGNKLEQFPSLSPKDWQELYCFAKHHTIEGIIYDSFQHLPEELVPPHHLLIKWSVRMEQIERHNKNVNLCIKEQREIFNKEGISPLLLKGQSIAACYPIPDHRIAGDIDWYFEGHDYQKANELFKHRAEKIYKIEKFSIAYPWKGIVTEHHKHMFDLHNPLSFKFLETLRKKALENPFYSFVDGNLIVTLPPMLMILQVNAHILKHLLSFGIGIRHLCDAARVYDAFHSQINGEELRHIYSRLGIIDWIHLLHAVLIKFIGLPASSLPFELPHTTNADWMWENIWRAGNFGFFDTRFQNRIAQGANKRSQSARRVCSNLFAYLKFAPMEVLSFPLVQLYSKFAGR